MEANYRPLTDFEVFVNTMRYASVRVISMDGLANVAVALPAVSVCPRGRFRPKVPIDAYGWSFQRFRTLKIL